MLRVFVTAMLALLLCHAIGCSVDKIEHISPAALRQNAEQLTGKKVVVDGCIAWGRHGAAILSCDRYSPRRGLRILDPDDQLGPAFGAVAGALPFGGEITAEVHGTVVAAEADQTEVSLGGPTSFLRVEKVLSPSRPGS